MDGKPVGAGDNPELLLEEDEGPLDVSALEPTAKERFLALFWRPEVFRVLRAVRPVLDLGDVVLLTRHDDVRAVLEHDREFHVEGCRIRKASGDHDFVLGMQDDHRCPFRSLQDAEQAACQSPPSYRDYQRWVMQHFQLEDLTRLRTQMRAVAERAIGHGGYVDAIAGLITHVAIDVCRDYYGVAVPREQESDFANTTFAISRWLFDPAKDSRFEGLGSEASARLRRRIHRSIALAKGDPRDTVIRRLVQADLPNAQICAIIFGMISGFVPTSTMAAGHILQVLLSRADAYQAASAAARAEDDVRLERCLFEAMRFKPLSREPLRVCQQPFTFAEGSRWKGSVKPADRVIAITASAMMDETAYPNPRKFDPDRALPHALLYGAGLHRCIGAPIASLHAVECLRALLRAGTLREIKCNGGMKMRCGPFPKHMLVGIEQL